MQPPLFRLHPHYRRQLLPLIVLYDRDVRSAFRCLLSMLLTIVSPMLKANIVSSVV